MLVACAQVTWQRTPFIPNDLADLTVSLRPVRYVLGFALGMRVPITARDGDRDCQVLITALTCQTSCPNCKHWPTSPTKRQASDDTSEDGFAMQATMKPTTGTPMQTRATNKLKARSPMVEVGLT
jgi:hypothetical protein